MSRPVHISLDVDDFKSLVNWEMIEKSNSNCDVKIILKDIWYLNMSNAIIDAFNNSKE